MTMQAVAGEAAPEKPTDADVVNAMLDIEPDLIDLVHMANIAFDMTTLLYAQVKELESGKVSIIASEGDRERFVFAVSNTASRADALRAAFYAARKEVRS